MDLDFVSNVVFHLLRRYSEVEFVFFLLNCYNLENLKCTTKKQMTDLWSRILRSNIGNKLTIFSSSRCSPEPERLISSPKCIACQTSFIEEPRFICEIQAQNTERPQQNVLVDRKICHLEHQVEELTKQIANLRMQLHCRPFPSVVVTGCPSTMSGGLPPPPPPMPTFSYVNQMENIKLQINKNKARISLGGSEGGPTQTSTPLLTLGDIMKGAKNVKLKKTARSPGGTPIRPPKSIETGSDLSAILARHLKRRHDSLNPCDSPRNNDSGSENSWQLSSPECSYGKTRRRPKILTLSPLHEANF